MAKFLASVLSFESFLHKVKVSLSGLREIEFIVESKCLRCHGLSLEIESEKSELESFKLDQAKLKDFIAILAHLSDQPALFLVDDGKLWLKGVIIN